MTCCHYVLGVNVFSMLRTCRKQELLKEILQNAILDLYHLYHGTGDWVGPRAGETGAENIVPTGIRSLDRPAHCESLSWPTPKYSGEDEYPSH